MFEDLLFGFLLGLIPGAMVGYGLLRLESTPAPEHTDPLAHLTPEERCLVLKRNPVPDDLERLGISLTSVRAPFSNQ